MSIRRFSLSTPDQSRRDRQSPVEARVGGRELRDRCQDFRIVILFSVAEQLSDMCQFPKKTLDDARWSSVYEHVVRCSCNGF
jgi:hypothetical protein